MPVREPSNTEILEFIKDNVATKEDLKQAITPLATKEELKQAIIPLATKEELRGLATKEELRQMSRDLHHKLDGIGKQLLDMRADNAANISAHRRFDHRDRVFAAKLAINLDKVGAEA